MWLLLFPVSPQVGLWCMLVVFPGHTHLLSDRNHYWLISTYRQLRLQYIFRSQVVARNIFMRPTYINKVQTDADVTSKLHQMGCM